VKLTAKDAHIDIVQEGETITLMNAHVRINQNFIKIELDKWSLVKKASPEDALSCEVNTEINVSEVEYELVQKENGSKSKHDDYELDSDEEDLSEQLKDLPVSKSSTRGRGSRGVDRGSGSYRGNSRGGYERGN
jgi:hypothetical protein